MNRWRIFGVLWLYVLSPSISAEHIKLALTSIPKVLEYRNSEAPYNQLVSHLEQQLNMPMELLFMPSSRSNQLLDSRKIDCVMPIVPGNNRKSETFLSTPINGIRAYLFSIPPAKYSSLDQLEGDLVLYLRGYLFGGLIREKSQINFFPVHNQMAALSMIEKGRAKAYLEYVPDLRLVFSPEQLSLLAFDEENPIIKSKDHMECLDTKKNRAFVAAFDREIKSLRASGRLAELLGKYYVSVE